MKELVTQVEWILKLVIGSWQAKRPNASAFGIISGIGELCAKE